MKKNSLSYLYIFTILLFVLGFFNILFAWLGFICMIAPFVILIKSGKNKWCKSYCPRASLFTTLFNGTKGRPIPTWLKKNWVKKAVLYYFIINVFILFMSTLMVILGNINSMEMVRFLIAFKLPWDMPQLLTITFLPSWVIHLSFRIYSMMLTSTIIGLILGWIYKPRTWCTICPVMTLSNMYLANQNNPA